MIMFIAKLFVAANIIIIIRYMLIYMYNPRY